MKNQNLNEDEILTKVIDVVGDLNSVFEYPYQTNSSGGEFEITKMKQVEDKINVSLNRVPKILSKYLKFPSTLKIGDHPMYNIGYAFEGDGLRFVESNYVILTKIAKTLSLITKYHIESLSNKDPIFILFSGSKAGKKYESFVNQVLYKELLPIHIPENYKLGLGEYSLLGIKFMYVSKIK